MQRIHEENPALCKSKQSFPSFPDYVSSEDSNEEIRVTPIDSRIRQKDFDPIFTAADKELS